MQSYRTLTRLPTTTRRVLKPLTIRKMSLFPRAFVSSDPSFTPLFRLLDDFDTYTRSTGGNGHHHRSHLRTFQPRFDVRELADAYELHGELPGIEQKDVEIEFADPQTLTIRGRTERSYTSGTTPSHLVEGSKSSGAITEGGEQSQSHKATVEDEDAANANTSTSVTTQEQTPQQPKFEAKNWVSERSVGEFARSFSFPVRVDQDSVKASMKNGILSVLVPKAKKHESRKITIS
jgi:HSP20 family protein